MICGTPGFVGARLRQSREAMGLTITSLSDLVGVSKQAISQYEKGADSPRQEVFERLCELLHHEPHFFLRPEQVWMMPSVMFFRSMASTTKGARQKSISRHQWMRELVNYLVTYVDLPKLNFPKDFDCPSDPNLIGMQEVEEAASRLRKYWGLGEGPIVNLVRTMEQHGAVVLRHPLEADTLDAVSGWAFPENVPYALLNSDKNCSVRSRLDLGHEIGHLLLHRNVSQATLNTQEMFGLIEKQAFRFGAALLLPAKPFLEDVYSISLDALKVLKRKWKVSIAMMIERLKSLEVIDTDQHRKLRMNYIARKWNRNEPFDDQLPVEQPSLVPEIVRILVAQNIQSIEQISANSGFSEYWIRSLMEIPPVLFNPPNIGLKVVSIRRA